MSNPKFRREFSKEKVDSLNKTALFKGKLSDDIVHGEVFPSIRNNVMHFYYKGGRLFEYTDKFKTNIKYGFVPDESYDYIVESDLKNIVPVKDFAKGYKVIKDRCSAYCHIEALGVSALYKDSAWRKKACQGDIVLLDIEAMFSRNDNENVNGAESIDDKIAPKYRHDRFDIVLYNNKSREIRVFEAKHFSNNELWSNNEPRVIEQIQRYENVIKDREKEIISAYTQQIEIMNNLFSKSYEAPKTICKRMGLLIFGFDTNQMTKITEQYKKRNVSIYKIGDVKKISASTLYKRLD